jgi:hypothetical protein
LTFFLDNLYRFFFIYWAGWKISFVTFFLKNTMDYYSVSLTWFLFGYSVSSTCFF